MSAKQMTDYTYDLPETAIAEEPVEPRDAARLLVGTADHHVRDLPNLLRDGDLLVLNDTRVVPARLALAKATGGAVEVLLLSPVSGLEWDALVRPGRRVPAGTVLFAPSGAAVLTVVSGFGATRRVRLLADPWAFGTIPLPPYLHGVVDPERYQTVYGIHPGSVAAPTAGLHLTHGLLDACRGAGIEIASVDLTVGLDTFRPVTVDDPSDHHMHSEAYRVPSATWDACMRTRAHGGRVVAVGTTVARALESVGSTRRLEGRTDLFIRPGFSFSVVDVLLTNFHLPRSSLLLLLEAFMGEEWRDWYGRALERGYRFLSLGDAMLVSRA